MIRAGADWIKLCTTGGVLSPLDPPDTPQFTSRRSGSPSRRRGPPDSRGVLAHAIGHEGIRNAVEGRRALNRARLHDRRGEHRR